MQNQAPLIGTPQTAFLHVARDACVHGALSFHTAFPGVGMH